MRPLLIFGPLAGLMAGWLSLRTWAGTHVAVWQVSCFLGAWAPLFAAGLFQYIRAVNDREDSVAAAWCVRALGMHSVLLWMIGVSDWLRGPPGALPRWNADFGMPVVFLSFVPVFLVSFKLIDWLLATVAKTTPAERAVEARTATLPPLPYRNAVTMDGVTETARPLPASVAAMLSLTVLLGALFALDQGVARMVVWPAAALLFAACSRVGKSAVVPSLGGLVVLGVTLGVRAEGAVTGSSIPSSLAASMTASIAEGVTFGVRTETAAASLSTITAGTSQLMTSSLFAAAGLVLYVGSLAVSLRVRPAAVR